VEIGGIGLLFLKLPMRIKYESTDFLSVV